MNHLQPPCRALRARRALVRATLFALAVSLLGPNPAPAQDRAEIKAEIGGALRFLSPDGPVKKGAAVAAVDPADIAAQLAKAIEDLAAAEAEQRALPGKQAAAKADLARKREAAQIALEAADWALARFRDKDQPSKEIGLKQAVADAKWNVDKENRIFSERDRMLREELISQAEHGEIEVRLRRAEGALVVAQNNLDAHLQFEKPLQMGNLERAAATARADFDAAAAPEKEFDAKAKAESDALAARVAALLARRADLVELLSRAVVRSPRDGNFKRALNPPPQGMPVTRGQPLGSVGN
jgi:multidrug resistance efflux pump